MNLGCDYQLDSYILILERGYRLLTDSTRGNGGKGGPRNGDFVSNEIFYLFILDASKPRLSNDLSVRV